MKIPELLTSVSGQKIDTVEKWENFRRKEIMSLFSEFVYGVRPVERPEDLTFSVEKAENWLNKGITRKFLKVNFSGYSFEAFGFQPDNVKEKMPCFIYVMHEYEAKRSNMETALDCEFVDIMEIVKRGYGVFIVPTYPLAPDWEHKCNYKEGIYPLFDKERKQNSWATISAWSWGASRVLDYIETDAEFEATKVTVAGHSRGGKTALWAGATDTRFFCAISNSSGCTGAAVLRGKMGEHIKDINITDWFCENYRSFNDNEDMLPVDQHMLIASLAPRFCYVQSSSEDEWADPSAERKACRMAKEVYELYGKKGIIIPDENDVKNDTAYHDGDVGYHAKTGGHSINHTDWKFFLDFLDKKLKQA